MPSERALLQTEQIVALLVVILAMERLASRTRVPLEILLVVGGVVLGLFHHLAPVIPATTLTPDLVLVAFLPPLLTSSAYAIPLAFFRRNLLPIGSLAVLLVLATALLAALVVHALLPEVPLAVALLFGAVIAPPDAVASTTVTQRMGLPVRMSTILQGEGLVNDATALTLYRVGIGIVMSGTFTFRMAAEQFVQAAAGGIAVGYLVIRVFERVLRRIDDAIVETVITLILPYVAYVAAEQLSASGILSAVAAGFFLREQATRLHGARTRLSARSVWSTTVFLVNGVLFVLMGSAVGEKIAAGLRWKPVEVGLVVTLAIVVLRIAWMLVAPRISRLLQPREEREPIPPARHLFVLGWAGMRGVVSLAAALSIPYVGPGGAPFPDRDALVLMTFVVIFTTLIGAGLTLPFVIRVLKIADPDAGAREEERARREAAGAALRKLEETGSQNGVPPSILEEMRRRYRLLAGETEERERREDQALRRVETETGEVERESVRRLRDAGEISDQTAQRLEREIDLRLVRVDERRTEGRT